MPGQRIWRRERLLLGPKECLSLDVGHGHGHVGGWLMSDPKLLALPMFQTVSPCLC